MPHIWERRLVVVVCVCACWADQLVSRGDITPVPVFWLFSAVVRAWKITSPPLVHTNTALLLRTN